MNIIQNKIISLLISLVAWHGSSYADSQDNEIRCGANLFGLHGHFNTPNYPEVYPDSLDCKWNITVPEGYEILLNFTQFDLEWTDYCQFDYVNVMSTNGSIGKYCGRRSAEAIPRVRVPPLEPMEIKSNTLQILLHTDYSNDVEVHGFEAHFAATDIDECAVDNGGCSHFCHNFIGSYYCSCRIGYLLHTDSKYCKVLCHNIYPQKQNGVITSPDYPNAYPPLAACDWHITAEKGYYVNLEFLDFDVEKHDVSVCPYDYVSVEDQNNKHGPYCGKSVPRKFRSASNWMIIEFFSDKELGFKGFKAKYWLESINCSRLETPKHGYMTGPTNFTLKETLHFSCKEGYELHGSNSRTCQSDGTWSGTEVNCTRIVCDDKSFATRVPIHGMLQGTTSNEPYFYGHEVIMKCNFWYDLLGTKTLKCQKNGTWSGGNNECVRTCGRSIRSFGNTNRALEQCNEGRHRAIALKYSQPWLVAIKSNGQIICSGVLISDQWVITATHCVKDAKERYGEKGSLEVVLGAYYWDNIEKYTEIRTVKEVVIKRGFDYGFHSDITLLKLSERLSLRTEMIQPICLGHERHHKHMFRGGKNVASIGWYTSGERYMTDRCLQIEKNRDKCKNHVMKIHLKLHKERYETLDGRKQKPPTDLLCTYPTRGISDNCQILPGSALVAYDSKARKWYLGGILTWGDRDQVNCKKYTHTYDTYSKIQKYMRWIKSATGLKPKDLDASTERNKWKS